MTCEFLREVSTPENIEKATSEHVIIWVHRVEEQRAQRSVLNNINEHKDFDVI